MNFLLQDCIEKSEKMVERLERERESAAECLGGDMRSVFTQMMDEALDQMREIRKELLRMQ